MREREAFQELDYRAVFGSIAKWATEIDDPARMPELISRAFHVATSGRPGPGRDRAARGHADRDGERRRRAAVRAGRDPSGAHPDGRTAEAALGGASGRSPSSAAAAGRRRPCGASPRFAERFALPVACSFRRQMLFSADHPSYAGDLGIGAEPEAARAGSRTPTSCCWSAGACRRCRRQAYTLFDIPAPRQTLVHVHPDAGRARPRLPRRISRINASPTAFRGRARRRAAAATRSAGATRTAAAHARTISPGATRPPSAIPARLQMGEVMAHLREVLPADTIICNGAGNFATWVHRFWPFRAYGTQLAPTSGSMGYGVPAGGRREAASGRTGPSWSSPATAAS